MGFCWCSILWENKPEVHKLWSKMPDFRIAMAWQLRWKGLTQKLKSTRRSFGSRNANSGARPGEILVIETFTPTPTIMATLRPVMTATPQPSSEEKPEEQAAIPENDQQAEGRIIWTIRPSWKRERAEAKNNYYWWLLGLPLIIGAAFWAFHQRRKSRTT